MLTRLTIQALLATAFTCAAAMAQDNPFLGRWDITGIGRHTDYVYWLEVRSDEGKLAGRFINRRGGLIDLPEIAIENGELVFSPGQSGNNPKPVHRARVEEGRLLGLLEQGDLEVAWIGVRPPNWANSYPLSRYRSGTPVVLFDGKSIKNWEALDKERPLGWGIVDGAMTNEESANNLVSLHRFEDFKIRCEYRIAPGGNSGIYLRGRYELQILDDAGKEPDIKGHMSVYSRVKPSVNASLPADQWQVMEAVIAGNRVTVTLNGRKVHDNVVIDGITGGAIDCQEGLPGPIMIQGDHGKVWFRSVVVTPLTRK